MVSGFLPHSLHLPTSHQTLIHHWVTFSNLVLLLISIADYIAAGSTIHLKWNWSLIRLPRWQLNAWQLFVVRISTGAVWVCKILPWVSPSSYISTLPGGFLYLVYLRLHGFMAAASRLEINIFPYPVSLLVFPSKGQKL